MVQSLACTKINLDLVLVFRSCFTCYTAVIIHPFVDTTLWLENPFGRSSLVKAPLKTMQHLVEFNTIGENTIKSISFYLFDFVFDLS